MSTTLTYYHSFMEPQNGSKVNKVQTADMHQHQHSFRVMLVFSGQIKVKY